jgi:nicotinate-nucleotide adenylyltransferase
MRLGFFGGTFDPPHRAHIAVARAAADRLRLDRVLLAPVGLQPLKRDTPPAPFADRLAMVRLACAKDDRLEASDLDAPRPDGEPNYTYETVVRLRNMLSPADKLFLLMGADAFRTLRLWFRAHDLMTLCCFIVAGRPGASLDTSLEQMDGFLPEGIRAERMGGDSGLEKYCLHGGLAEGRTLYLMPDLRYDAAATSIRTLLASDEEEGAAEAAAGLDPNVAAYARARELYRKR